jgi:copper(I)-binding protein
VRSSGRAAVLKVIIKGKNSTELFEEGPHIMLFGRNGLAD